MADSETRVLLEARNLTRRGRGGAVLLDRVSLRVAAGERWAITGPTGSGKTLLLRALAMLDAMDAGEIRWRGDLVADHDVPAFRRSVIYLHQRPALIEGTVQANLQLPFAYRVNRDLDYDRERCVELLAALNFDAAFLDKHASDLSGGESQVTAILRALQLGPTILLLDEPTAALDAQSTQLVEQMVDRWFRATPDERAVVWVTHDAGQSRRVAERMLQIDHGRISPPAEPPDVGIEGP